MVKQFQSFFAISLAFGFASLFLVVMVQTVSEPRPGFSRLPAPTAIKIGLTQDSHIN